MNVVKEIQRLNDRELELGSSNASWHDQYKDSAYIFIGGLHFELTEGDVITIFSQYGEVMDVNLPRDKETGKTKGFGFLLYEDQRSTVLAVDNLNGAKVLERTLRVDHVQNYRQPKVKGEEGEMVEREEQSLNAKPEFIEDSSDSEPDGTPPPEIDPEDPMRDYLIAKFKEEKTKKKSKKKSKHSDETPQERKERKRARREKAGALSARRGKMREIEGRSSEEKRSRYSGRYGHPQQPRSRSRDRARSRSPYSRR